MPLAVPVAAWHNYWYQAAWEIIGYAAKMFWFVLPVKSSRMAALSSMPRSPIELTFRGFHISIGL